ncbi:MAG: response regulator [Pseudomonadota bacterium]
MTDRPKQVLLVEDEDNIAMALEFLINREGFDLKRVSTGEAAMDALDEARPDLVVLDVMLPETSGYEVCQHIRERDDLRDIKVLMMSAAGDMARRKGLALGADAFFVKPFDTKLLRDEINALLAPPSNA